MFAAADHVDPLNVDVAVSGFSFAPPKVIAELVEPTVTQSLRVAGRLPVADHAVPL